jgi:hypothetical protein
MPPEIEPGIMLGQQTASARLPNFESTPSYLSEVDFSRFGLESVTDMLSSIVHFHRITKLASEPVMSYRISGMGGSNPNLGAHSQLGLPTNPEQARQRPINVQAISLPLVNMWSGKLW